MAIGAVTRLLADHLNRRTNHNINTGRPEDSASVQAPTLNLFLYEVVFDPSLRNHPLVEGQKPPLWLTLRYLLTGFDDGGSSDSPEAHEVLGEGISALQEIAMFGLDDSALMLPGVPAPLEDNPEPLKLTFDECTPDLLNKILQASDDEYRVSVAFQVRPVMIVPPERPSFNLLVGVDYTTTPVSLSGSPVGLDVLASLGPRLHTVQPGSFQIGDEFEIRGEDLHLSDLECRLGPVTLGITRQRPDRLGVRVEAGLEGGTLISAGEHPLVLRQFLPGSRRYRASNLLSGRLLPTVTGATTGAVVEDGDHFVETTVTVTGFLLGRNEDAILAALYRNGQATHLFDVVKPSPGPGDPPDNQQQFSFLIPLAARVLRGTYQLIVLVNSQQARRSPLLVLEP